MRDTDRRYHSGTVSSSVEIRASAPVVWGHVSRIMRLEEWVSGAVRTTHIGGAASGTGARRMIEFDSGSGVDEIITGWSPGRYLSYIMLAGLPLRTYHATISLEARPGGATRVVWRSYCGSKMATHKDFGQILSTFNKLYRTSLVNLKHKIEKGAK